MNCSRHSQLLRYLTLPNMASYVYLLAHPTQSRFKIGKAVDIHARIQQLGADQFDLDNSQALAVTTEEDSSNLEKLLHRAFIQWRIDSAVITIDEGARREGASEWFDMACRERLSTFIRDNKDILQCTELSSPELKALVTACEKNKRVPQQKSPEQRAIEEQRAHKRQLQLEQKHIRTAQIKVEFDAIIESIPPVLNVLNELSDGLELHDSEYPGMKYLIGRSSKENWGDVRSVLESLTDFQLRSELGGANIFPSISSYTVSDDSTMFRLAVLWSANLTGADVMDDALAKLHNLPTNIKGWRGQREPWLGANTPIIDMT